MVKDINFDKKKFVLQFNGMFDLEGMYAAIIDWAKNYNFMWQETVYKHKVPSPTGAEQEMKWVMTQEVTEYLKYTITLTVHIWDLLDVQVEKDGKKKTVNSARIYIWFEPKMTLDWNKQFSGKFGWLEKWYNKAIDKDIGAKYADTIWYRTLDLHALVKKYFDLQSKKYAYKGYLKEN